MDTNYRQKRETIRERNSKKINDLLGMMPSFIKDMVKHFSLTSISIVLNKGDSNSGEYSLCSKTKIDLFKLDKIYFS